MPIGRRNGDFAFAGDLRGADIISRNVPGVRQTAREEFHALHKHGPPSRFAPGGGASKESAGSPWMGPAITARPNGHTRTLRNAERVNVNETPGIENY